MNKAGIDYAIASPAICIEENGVLFFYFFTSVKKHIGIIQSGVVNIMGIEYNKNDFDDDLKRFDWLSDQIIDLLQQHGVQKVNLEGYSMGSSSSRLFQIGENTGILKKKMNDHAFFFSVIAPTSIKKHATGYGNANKERMVESFQEQTDIDLFSLFEQTTIKKPIEDLADSYLILNYQKG